MEKGQKDRKTPQKEQRDQKNKRAQKQKGKREQFGGGAVCLRRDGGDRGHVAKEGRK